MKNDDRAGAQRECDGSFAILILSLYAMSDAFAEANVRDVFLGRPLEEFEDALHRTLGAMNAADPCLSAERWLGVLLARKRAQFSSFEARRPTHWLMAWPLAGPGLPDSVTAVENLICWLAVILSPKLYAASRARVLATALPPQGTRWAVVWLNMVAELARRMATPRATKRPSSTGASKLLPLEPHPSVLAGLGDQAELECAENERPAKYLDATYAQRSRRFDPLVEGVPCWLCPVNVVLLPEHSTSFENQVLYPPRALEPFAQPGLVRYFNVVVASCVPQMDCTDLVDEADACLFWQPRNKNKTMAAVIEQLAKRSADQSSPVRVLIHPVGIAVAHQFLVALQLEYGRRLGPSLVGEEEIAFWTSLVLRDVRLVLWRAVTLNALVDEDDEGRAGLHSRGCPAGRLPADCQNWMQCDGRSGEDASKERLRHAKLDFPRSFDPREKDNEEEGHVFSLLSVAQPNISQALRNRYGKPTPQKWTPTDCCFCVPESSLCDERSVSKFLESELWLEHRDVEDNMTWLTRGSFASGMDIRRRVLVARRFPHLRPALLQRSPGGKDIRLPLTPCPKESI